MQGGHGSNLVGLYKHNRSVAIDILRQFGPLTIGELAERMGLRSASVGSMLRDLQELGLVESAGVGQSSGGRPPALFQIARRRRCALVADLSGADIVTAVVDLSGEVLLRESCPRPRDPGEIYDALCDALEAARRGAPEVPVGIGVAVPGLIDSATGSVTLSAPLRWTDFPLRERLESAFGIPVTVGKETEAALLAEYCHGERGKAENLLLVNIGSGVGVGMIIDGRPFRGSHETAGEWGHTIVLPDGPMCWCGNRGCLEEVASLHALVRYVDDRLRDRKRRAQSRIGRSEDPEELDAFGAVDDPSQSAEEVLRSASLGDRDCLEAVDQVAKYLGRGLFNLLQLFDPEVVVIEVSVGEGAEVLSAAVQRHLSQYRLLASGPLTIRESALRGGTARLIGAGLWVFDKAVESMKELLVQS